MVDRSTIDNVIGVIQKLSCLNLNRQQILNENIRLHKSQAYYYEVNHPEIFNILEQARIKKQVMALKKDAGTGLCIDVGSGTGNLSRQLKAAGFEVVACDLSRDMLQQNRAEFRVRCEASMLPIKTECASLVTGYSIFHHLPDSETALKEACRIAGKKGFLYFDHDDFVQRGDKKSGTVTIKRVVLACCWLLENPRYFCRAAKYVMGGRKKHLLDLRSVDWNLTDKNTFEFQEFKKILQRNGFTGLLSLYGEGSFVKVQRTLT